MNRLPLAVASLAVAAWLASRPEAAACGGATRPGERVDVADETALIIWDAKTKTQHFVRRATVQSTGYDFGFLVPTPSRPELSEADDDLFTELAKLTAPKTEIITEDGPPIGGCGGGAISTAPNGERFVPGGGVVVLEKKRVGDFDAAVLGFHPDAKNDPAAGAAELDAWLVKNRYAFTPSLRSWVEPYVRNGWVITAFKIAADFKPADNKEPAPAGKATVNLGARPVCMSFKTDRPFFPYREPEDQRDERAKSVPRLLRVFVAAPRRYAGKLGDGTQPWPGKTVWAGEIGPPQWETVFAHAKGLVPTPPDPQGWWLTEFEDRSTPRPGTDEVYLEPSADTSPVSRQPNIIYVHRTPWWYGVLCCGWPLFAALLVYFGVRWSSRRK